MIECITPYKILSRTLFPRKDRAGHGSLPYDQPSKAWRTTPNLRPLVLLLEVANFFRSRLPAAHFHSSLSHRKARSHSLFRYQASRERMQNAYLPRYFQFFQSSCNHSWSGQVIVFMKSDRKTKSYNDGGEERVFLASDTSYILRASARWYVPSFGFGCRKGRA